MEISQSPPYSYAVFNQTTGQSYIQVFYQTNATSEDHPFIFRLTSDDGNWIDIYQQQNQGVTFDWDNGINATDIYLTPNTWYNFTLSLYLDPTQGTHSSAILWLNQTIIVQQNMSVVDAYDIDQIQFPNSNTAIDHYDDIIVSTQPISGPSLDQFVFSSVGAQTAGMSFSVTITAVDASGKTVTSYSGTPTLTCSAGSVTPSSATGGFSNGVWTGSVTVAAAGSDVTLGVDDGSGHTGTSNSFTVNPTITASAEANGVINPTGNVSVNFGGSQSFNVTANVGYHIVDVVVENVSQGAVSSYTFSNVTAAHSITSSFAINTYTITVTQSANGQIAPGTTNVNYGGSQSFTITPDSGYYIASITNDTGAVMITSPSGQTVSFTNVQAVHTITATFALTPAPTPAPTAAPNPTSTPSPSPTATSTPAPTPSSTTVPATTDTGSTVDLTISGNVTSTQMSNVTIATNQSTSTTTMSFTVTGESGTTGFGNVTIPKTAVPYGTTPTIYIDNLPAQDQGYAQDSNNYYLWYTTHFSTHQVSIVFKTTSFTPSPTTQSGLPQKAIIGIVAAVAIVAIVAVALVLRKGKKGKS